MYLFLFLIKNQYPVYGPLQVSIFVKKGITTLKTIDNVVQDGSYIHDTYRGIIKLKIQ